MSFVSHFANTMVGKPGNIGVRTERIIRTLSAQGNRGCCVSRKAVMRSDGFDYIDMGWLGHVPRALNALRIYLFPGFNHRYMDIRLFEWFTLRHFERAVSENNPIAHVWDSCPRLLQKLKACGIPIVLDMPVAPISYSQRVSETFGLDFLMVHNSMLEFEQRALDLADLVLAPSSFVAEELILSGVTQHKIRVVEFGVDLPVSPIRHREIKDSGQPLSFAFAGNINRRKGVDLLLEAWKDECFANDYLHLCGRHYPEIKLPSRANLVLPGFINTFEYLANCDVFVFPSWLEGSAKAIFEAMACGLPVITTEASGSVIRDGVDGFVIAPGDVAALRERMLWFKQHPQQIATMGSAAKQRVNEFSWQRYSDRVIEVYQTVGEWA